MTETPELDDMHITIAEPEFVTNLHHSMWIVARDWPLMDYRPLAEQLYAQMMGWA